MDRQQLKEWLDEGLSLPQIGALTGRPAGTIGYWVNKYGLVANGRDAYSPKGGLTREQLEPMVEAGATLQEIADELGVSISMVRRWLARHGLRTLRAGRGRTELARRARAEGSNRFVAECQRHGRTEFLAFEGGHSRCARCNANGVANRRRRVKQALIEEAGGRCVICGYDRHPAALQFHHIDPERKEFGLASRGITVGIERLRAEAAKCVLLCANCHAEVEVGFIELPVRFQAAG